MATNPYFTQLHTQRFSFIGSPQQRNGLYQKDQRFLNMYPELIKSPITDGKKYYLKKRPGLVNFSTPSGGTGVGRGVFYWNNSYYNVVGNTLYIGSTPLFTLTTSSGQCGFTVFEFSTGGSQLIFSDGISMWAITTTNSFTILSGYPTPHIPTPIYLDGYIFVAQLNSTTIWNSALDDPTAWPTDGFINCEMYPYVIQNLAKVQNYLAAITTGSIEWFYDNANATGSPLNRNAPAVSQFGTPAASSVNQTEIELILIGQTDNGGHTVWMINGFQPQEIGNEPVREALDAEGDLLYTASAFTIQCAGHKWYVMNLYSNQRTFVFDFEEQMWHEWSSFLTQSCFRGIYATDSSAGTPTIQDNTTGVLYQLNPFQYSDFGNAINCQVTTSKIDFDTIMRKRIFRLSLVCDGPNADDNVPMTLNWSDDDYNTWQGNFTLNVNSFYPTVTQLGITRRRAFQFIFVENYPLRLESFEVDIIQEVRR
jgi:hypothetical protein